MLTLPVSLLSMIAFFVTSCTREVITTADPDMQSTIQPVTNPAARSAGDTIFSVLQFNTWMDGNLDLVANEIAARQPDFVTFSETQDKDSFYVRMIRKLQNKGLTYYGGPGRNTSVISKYPIQTYGQVYGSTFTKLLTKIKGREIAVYSGHLDYTHYACYYPRGYDPVNWSRLPSPVTDVTQIRNMNLASTRDEEIAAFITEAQKDVQAGHIVILGGDFNEPSHLDWTEAAKNLYDHRGVVMPWTTTLALANAGYKDTYRVLYPDAVSHPGFTWVYQSDWAPLSDERDRIDYIFCSGDTGLSVQDAYIVGPDSSIVRHVLTKETSLDKFSKPVGRWPSDHKALMTVFSLKAAPEPRITVNKTSYTQGENVLISFTNGSADPYAWIGIYQGSKTPGNQYSDAWAYTNGATSGTLSLKLPAGAPSGAYYVAYFNNNNYTEIARRVSFTYSQ